MRQTSLLAFHSLSNVQISQRQKQVLEALQEIQPATNRMVSEHSKIPINVVTPRMGELVKRKLVEQAHVGYDQLHRKAIFWKVTEDV